MISALDSNHSTPAGEIYVDSLKKKTTFSACDDSLRSFPCPVLESKSEVYFPRGLDAQPKVPSYRTVYTNDELKSNCTQNNILAYQLNVIF